VELEEMVERLAPKLKTATQRLEQMVVEQQY
jgi:hypothetical protein